MRVPLRIVAVVVAATAGCGNPGAPDPGLTATVTVGAPVVRPGGSVTVSLRVGNPGSRAAAFAAPGCPEAFEVLDAAGRVVGPPDRFCTLNTRGSVMLAPGEAYAFDDVWAGDVRASGYTSGFGVRAMPGVYRIRARVLGQGGVIGSDPVELRVEP